MTTQILPKSLWKFYLKYAFRGNYCVIIAWAICWLVASFENVLFPFYQKWLVAALESPIPDGVSWLSYILPTILLIIGLDVVLFVFILLRSVFIFRWAPSVDKQMSVILTNYTQSQSMSWWVSRLPGKVNQQMIYIRNLDSIMESLWWCICTFLMICINSGMLFRINSYVAIMFLCAFSFRVVFAWEMRKKVKNASEEKASAQSTLSGKLVDSLSNYTIVKSFAGAKREEAYLEPHRNKKIKAARHFGFLNRLFWGIPGTLWSVFFGGTLFFCSMLYYRGEMTIADIVFTIGVFFSVMGSINVLINRIPDIIDKVSSASKSYRELVSNIDVADIDNAPDLHVTRGAIEFQKVSFKYRKKYILRDFNLKIKPGERVGIVGLSGAGKTTLVNLLMRFYDPNSGAVLIDGQNIAKVSQSSLRENISYIPQEPTMFNRTIAENIEYGRPGATLREIKAAAQEASADEFIKMTDKKYDSLVGDRGIKLSGGQRQRIAIARAFLKNAPILILDEATSALDSETEIAIQKSFDKLSVGHTTLVVAHRLSTLRNMDRIIVLDKGRVIESGAHNSLIRKHGLYSKLWKMQSGGFLQEK
ncbi:MAG: ABC transporter ATP-binding protein/permease [Alphaproteobacteria bacterium]|nr:ABC transporter ATP-binding protein/permease [Alphaproteobacteria bacterium]